MNCPYCSTAPEHTPAAHHDGLAAVQVAMTCAARGDDRATRMWTQVARRIYYDLRHVRSS